MPYFIVERGEDPNTRLLITADRVRTITANTCACWAIEHFREKSHPYLAERAEGTVTRNACAECREYHSSCAQPLDVTGPDVDV